MHDQANRPPHGNRSVRRRNLRTRVEAKPLGTPWKPARQRLSRHLEHDPETAFNVAFNGNPPSSQFNHLRSESQSQTPTSGGRETRDKNLVHLCIGHPRSVVVDPEQNRIILRSAGDPRASCKFHRICCQVVKCPTQPRPIHSNVHVSFTPSIGAPVLHLVGFATHHPANLGNQSCHTDGVARESQCRLLQVVELQSGLEVKYPTVCQAAHRFNISCFLRIPDSEHSLQRRCQAGDCVELCHGCLKKSTTLLLIAPGSTVNVSRVNHG
mmetsp:Transcript_38287/g.85898  ORF Transcript_38287/g.85898 Transcript_38287/m.85898 type:complete len:268 (+) Transcript_38287:1247-2050(+)